MLIKLVDLLLVVLDKLVATLVKLNTLVKLIVFVKLASLIQLTALIILMTSYSQIKIMT